MSTKTGEMTSADYDAVSKELFGNTAWTRLRGGDRDKFREGLWALKRLKTATMEAQRIVPRAARAFAGVEHGKTP